MHGENSKFHKTVKLTFNNIIRAMARLMLFEILTTFNPLHLAVSLDSSLYLRTSFVESFFCETCERKARYIIHLKIIKYNNSVNKTGI